MLTFLLITAVFLAALVSFLRKRAQLPPGPIPLPGLGNLLQLGWLSRNGKGITGAMKELKKQYGPVFTLWLGPIPSVHICSMEVAQETMVKRGAEFSDRWAPRMFNYSIDGIGIVNTSGEHWQEQRRFALHTLRNFGLGRSLMEERIMEEFDKNLESLNDKLKNGPCDLDTYTFISVMVANIINRMLFSERFDKQKEDEFFEQKKKMDEFVENFSIIDQLAEYEIFWKIPFLAKRWNHIQTQQFAIKDFLRRQVQLRKAAIASGEHVIGHDPQDYVDAFLLKMKEEQNTKTETTYTDSNLATNIVDLWVAGQETTTTTISIGLYLLIQNPEVIKTLKEELRSVTGGLRNLSLKDKPQTVYFNAVLTEIQRVANIVNVNLFRRTRENTVVGGYTVPSGTPLTAEISVLMADDDRFENPEKFDPSRYLKNNNLEQHVVPFGIGKRACLGESLARAELYLIIGNLLLRYDIGKPTFHTLEPLIEDAKFFKSAPRYHMSMARDL